jgi:hypothetical protein
MQRFEKQPVVLGFAPASRQAGAKHQKRMRPTRLHQLDSVFAIFGSVSGGKALYFRVWQIENRL